MKGLGISLIRLLPKITRYLDVLPASEGAIEELGLIDDEERDDIKLEGDNSHIDSTLETPRPSWKYREVAPIPRVNNHFFRYFLDGSYRHYFLATGLEHDHATPIFLSQIAIVIAKRDNNGKLSLVPEFRRHQWFLLIAKSRISTAAWNEIERATQEAEVNILLKDLAEVDPISGEAGATTELREKGRSKTRYIMSKMEFDLVTEFREKMPNHWMIKDGIVSWGKSGDVMKAPRLIGVSKRFTTNQQFFVEGQKKKERESVASLLKNLPAHHRTPAYEGYAGKSAFWYLRLRKSQQMLYPLYGVIKVQIPVLEAQPLTKELIDEISGALLAEQFVTPYGSDERWHTHLYPIYQAENAAKQLFSSTQVVQGCINNALGRQRNEQ